MEAVHRHKYYRLVKMFDIFKKILFTNFIVSFRYNSSIKHDLLTKISRSSISYRSQGETADIVIRRIPCKKQTRKIEQTVEAINATSFLDSLE